MRIARLLQAPIRARPAIPRLGLKLLSTTVVASVIFGLCYVVYVNRLLPLDRLAEWLRGGH